jgi:hypothetical protein
LERFLDHLIGLHRNIQFTMEMEDGHLPYLDVDICRQLDSYLGHKVYQKLPMQTSTQTLVHITILPTNRFLQLWCTGPRVCVTRKASMMNWISLQPLSGKTGAVLRRYSVLST